MENFRNKLFISFKLHAILSSLMKAGLLCPPGDRNPPFAQASTLCAPPLVGHWVASWLPGQSWRYCSACVQGTLILFNSGPKEWGRWQFGYAKEEPWHVHSPCKALVWSAVSEIPWGSWNYALQMRGNYCVWNCSLCSVAVGPPHPKKGETKEQPITR